MPHSATASLAQSALSRCIESRIEHVLDALPHGDSVLLDVLVGTFVADTAAYAGGRLFGRFTTVEAIYHSAGEHLQEHRAQIEQGLGRA